MPGPFADELYDVLVEHAGASPDLRERAMFVVYACKEVSGDRSLEYRFGGLLGFGGKLYVNGNGVYVDCYPEDMTVERLAVCASANGAIRNLLAESKWA